MKTKKHVLPARLEIDVASSSINMRKGGTPSRFYHAVNPGDLIAAMGAIKSFYEKTGRKAIVSQSVTQKAAYYQGAVHPTVNELGENVCCNDYMWDMLKPLIESQEYVESFEKYSGQRIDIDLNIIRGKTFVNMPQGPIQGWIPLAFPDLHFDISKPWMKVKGKCPKKIFSQVNGKIILNFTERYRNVNIDYFFLKNYAPDLIFAGTDKEHWLFCNQWGLSIPRLEVNDFHELAHAIMASRFILGNQSMCINIAYALGKMRITELCSYAQNVIHMVGDHCYGFFYQTGVEYYFRDLYRKTVR